MTTVTSGQSNLTKDRIAAAHGRFNRIHQVAPICTLSAFAPYRFCTSLSRFEHIDLHVTHTCVASPARKV